MRWSSRRSRLIAVTGMVSDSGRSAVEAENGDHGLQVHFAILVLRFPVMRSNSAHFHALAAGENPAGYVRRPRSMISWPVLIPGDWWQACYGRQIAAHSALCSFTCRIISSVS